MVLAMLFGDDNCVDIHDEDWQCLMMSADFGLNSGAFEWKIWKAGWSHHHRRCRQNLD